MKKKFVKIDQSELRFTALGLFLLGLLNATSAGASFAEGSLLFGSIMTLGALGWAHSAVVLWTRPTVEDKE